MTCRLRWLKTKKVPECIVTWFLSSFQGNQRLSGGWQLSGRVATAEGSLRSYSKVVKFSCLMLWIVSLSSLWLIRIPVYTTYPPPVVFLFEKKEDDESKVPTTNFTEVLLMLLEVRNVTLNFLTFVFPKACGGRISVTELPNEMGISLEHVEARVEVKNSTRVLWFDFNCFAYSGIHPLEGDSIEFMVRLGEIKFFGSPWITEQKNDENDPRPCENVMVPCTSWTMTCCRAEGCWRVLSWPCERCSHGSLTLTWHLTLWSVSLKLIDVFPKRSSALFS